MNDDYNAERSCHGGHCPDFLAKLPMDRKVKVVLGAAIVLLAFLSTLTFWSGFDWLLIILGGLVIYGGYTGNCLLTHCMRKYCCERDDDIIVRSSDDKPL